MESMLPAATGADVALSFKLIGHRVAEGLELFTRSFTGSLVYLVDGGVRILLLHRRATHKWRKDVSKPLMSQARSPLFAFDC